MNGAYRNARRSGKISHAFHSNASRIPRHGSGICAKGEMRYARIRIFFLSSLFDLTAATVWADLCQTHGTVIVPVIRQLEKTMIGVSRAALAAALLGCALPVASAQEDSHWLV